MSPYFGTQTNTDDVTALACISSGTRACDFLIQATPLLFRHDDDITCHCT